MILKTLDHSTGSHNEVNFLVYTVGDERNMTNWRKVVHRKNAFHSVR